MVCTQIHTHMHSTHTFGMGVEGDILDIWIWVDMGGYEWIWVDMDGGYTYFSPI